MTSAKHRRRLERFVAFDGLVPTCVECGETGTLTTYGAAGIYLHRPDLVEKPCYLCRCGAYVGCHAGATSPLGKPAGRETRTARIAAHKVFDPLWQARVAQGVKQHVARGKAYKWLAREMNMRPEDCHISWFDKDQARRAQHICEPFAGAAKRILRGEAENKARTGP